MSIKKVPIPPPNRKDGQIEYVSSTKSYREPKYFVSKHRDLKPSLIGKELLPKQEMIAPDISKEEADYIDKRIVDFYGVASNVTDPAIIQMSNIFKIIKELETFGSGNTTILYDEFNRIQRITTREDVTNLLRLRKTYIYNPTNKFRIDKIDKELYWGTNPPRGVQTGDLRAKIIYNCSYNSKNMLTNLTVESIYYVQILEQL